LHPRGLQERRIHGLAELEGLDPKIHIIRISARVGERKKIALLDELRHRNFHIANPGKEEEKPVTTDEPVAEAASSSKETGIPSDSSEKEDVTSESASPETMEESAMEDDNAEEEDK
jgi:large subunit ribosomal protein L32e